MSSTHPGAVDAERLTALVDQLATELTALPEASFTERRAADQWSAAEVVGHLTELIPFWAHRAVVIARQPGGSWGRSLDDPDRVGAVAAAGDVPRGEALTRLRAAAHEAAALLSSIDDAGWHATGIHSERGDTPVAELVKTGLIAHVESHVRQATAAAQAAH